ncbi:hypothetical protein [Deinococcus planocerae]|uniref:hypothetical protein n=1 Tax=Deinococcus planocerae TaxID=1737569 RepID=UPI0011AFCF35|nr:hypothetical protein [Deinococcus planocerae]
MSRVQAVLSPDLWEAHRVPLRDARALIVQGEVTVRGRAVTVHVLRLRELPVGGVRQAADQGVDQVRNARPGGCSPSRRLIRLTFPGQENSAQFGERGRRTHVRGTTSLGSSLGQERDDTAS